MLIISVEEGGVYCFPLLYTTLRTLLVKCYPFDWRS